MYSHPVATSHGTVGVRSVVESAAFDDLTTLAGNGAGLGNVGTGARGDTSKALTALLLFGVLVLLASVHDHSRVLLVLVDSPVENVVVLERLANEEIAEDLAEVGVVGLVVEAKGAGVVEVDSELVGESTAEDLGGGGHLLLHDTVVLLLLSSSLQTLPGEGTTAEVEHDVAERLHVITARLLNTQVSVDTGVTGSTSKVLVLTVGDVEVSLRVTVLLRETEINDIDLVSALADTHQEVVGLDVTVDEGLGVDVFNSGNELIGEEKDGLQGELAVAEVEQILQTGAEEIDDHGVVVTFGSEPADERDTDTTSKGLVDTGFIFELRVLGLDVLELDGDLFTGDDVGACDGELDVQGGFGNRTYRGKCHRNYHYRSYDRCGTCYRRANPVKGVSGNGRPTLLSTQEGDQISRQVLGARGFWHRTKQKNRTGVGEANTDHSRHLGEMVHKAKPWGMTWLERQRMLDAE